MQSKSFLFISYSTGPSSADFLHGVINNTGKCPTLRLGRSFGENGRSSTHDKEHFHKHQAAPTLKESPWSLPSPLDPNARGSASLSSQALGFQTWAWVRPHPLAPSNRSRENAAWTSNFWTHACTRRLTLSIDKLANEKMETCAAIYMKRCLSPSLSQIPASNIQHYSTKKGLTQYI